MAAFHLAAGAWSSVAVGLAGTVGGSVAASTAGGVGGSVACSEGARAAVAKETVACQHQVDVPAVRAVNAAASDLCL